MAKLISATYADALFEVAVEKDSVDKLYEEVLELKKILEENTEYDRLMNHPKILREDKEAVMESVFKGRLSDELVGLLNIVIENRRYEHIESILDHFIDSVKEYKKIGVAYVSTPSELSAAQKKAVEKKLLETTGYKSMEMNYQIDEALIGGMVIRIGDRVVDSSIASKLDSLKKELLDIQLAV
ncbi:MAG: F0F1 ATP synthase subunit delta [Lachnospiraceae bacterium]|nr:F0F1 ATP synthase subunit delta [Lachnospiraceae bacterium]